MRRVSNTAYRCHWRVLLQPAWQVATMASLLCLWLPLSTAISDTVTLRDGTVHEGRVIERTRDQILFEVNSGGMMSRLPLDTRDIVDLTISRPEAAQLADAFAMRWTAATQTATAAAFAEVGQWAQANKLHEEAARAFDKAGRLNPDRQAEYGLAAAMNLALGNDVRQARLRLRGLATTYPDDDLIAGELARLEQRAQRQVDDRLRQAVDSYRKADMRSAIIIMERLVRLDIDDLSARADQAANQQVGMPFARLLADARLQQHCGHCTGEMQAGLMACTQCRGSGRIVKTRLETLTEKDPKTGIERRRTYQVEYHTACPTCRGFAATLCPLCGGAGVDIGTVGAMERPYVIDGLRRRIDALVERIGPVAADPAALHPVNLEVVHLGALRLRYYLQQYVSLNADLAGDDLLTIADRRVQVDNLLRHTSAQYRNRDLEEYKKILEAQLLELARREGILTPADLDFDEPPEPSTSDTRLPTRH